MKSALLTTALLLFSTILFGQGQSTTGALTGVVIDDEANEPMPFATVVIKGTTKGTTTDIDGKYQILGVEPGIYTLVASFVGYQPIEIEGVIVEPGKTTETSMNMGADEVKLEEVVVTAKAQTESEMTLIQVQRKSIDIKQSIGAQELSRKGVSDAEGAVTKVTGVSKQDGQKNVFVRGLGDRYNSTSLNGLPLPSEDPEYKNISLNFFNADIINSVDINKTFGTSLYGDVGGANINVVSKELFEDKELSISGSLGGNSQVLGSQFTRIDGTTYAGAKSVNPINNLGEYSFQNSFDPYTQQSPLNSSFSLQGGKRFYIGEKTLSALIIASSGSSYNFRKGIARSSLGVNGGFGRDFDAVRYDYQTDQSVMGNFNLEINKQLGVSYNTLFIHNNAQRFGEYLGFAQNLSEVDGTTAFIRRQQVNDNTLLVNQVLAEYKPTDRLGFDLGAGINLVSGNEPDRRTNTFILDDATNTYQVAAGSAGLNHRFFSELNETEFVGKVVGKYTLTNDNESNNALTVGYNFRGTDRGFAYQQFSFNITGARPQVELDNVDGVFNQANINNGTFEILTNRGRGSNPAALVQDTYDGNRAIHAGFVNLTYDLTPVLTLDGGVRVENIHQEVTWDFNQDRRRFEGDNLTTIDKTYILPSINAKYLLNEDNILRAAASKSYTMPQFKEVAPFLYEDIAFSSFGNPDLVPSDVYNLDIKFDHYFSRGELISIGGFYKQIHNSINRILVESAATEMSYVNSGDSDVMGVEVELRKTVLSIGTNSYFDAGFNASYLYTNQQLVDTDADQLQPRFTNSKSQLQGASPLLINADLTYHKDGEGINMTSALIFNSFYDRIYTIGTSGVNDIVEVSVPLLDWVSKLELNERVSLGLNVKNILNPLVKRESQDATTGKQLLINSYQNGTQVSVGFTYRLK